MEAFDRGDTVTLIFAASKKPQSRNPDLKIENKAGGFRPVLMPKETSGVWTVQRGPGPHAVGRAEAALLPRVHRHTRHDGGTPPPWDVGLQARVAV